MLKIIIHLSLFILITLSSTVFAKSSEIRQYPYPFSHVVSFTSDIDMQLPWFTEAFHTYFNEQWGLPISDSTWIQVSNPALSGIFQTNMSLNRSSENISPRNTFFSILSQWHRGNVDHIHSWQDDAIYRYIIYSSEEGLKINFDETSQKIQVDSLPPSAQGYFYSNIRFFLTQIPPETLSIVLYDANGEKVEISPTAIKNALSLQKEQGELICLNLVIIPDYNPNIVFSSSKFLLTHIQSIEFRNDAKQSSSENLKIMKIEVDNFSRETVLQQSTLLEKFHIHPLLHTSHGGNTCSQNICNESHIPVIPPEQFSIEPVDRILKCYAHDIHRHAYHMDILKNIGVRILWPSSYIEFFDATNYFPLMVDPTESPQLLSDFYSFFYLLRRTGNPSDQKQHLMNFFCHLDKEFIYQFIDFSKENSPYFSPSGALLMGGYLLHALDTIKAGFSVNHLWYTHFGTITYVTEYNLSPSNPLPKELKLTGKTFSNYMYNIQGNIPLNHRIWVTSASTYLRYFMTFPYLEQHAQIDFERSKVSISKTIDTTTGQEVPDTRFGTRDLHGMTFYLKDPLQADVSVDGKKIEIFTINPPDETLKPSITLVDDHLPTELIPTQTSLTDQGEVNSHNMNFETSSEGLMLTATQDGDCSIEFFPFDLAVWNISHLHFDWDIKKSLHSKLYIEITRADGQVVGLFEDIKDLPERVQGYHAIDPLLPKVTLAQDQFKFNVDFAKLTSIPLVMGKLTKIKIGLKNCTKNDSLLLKKFLAFRPNGNDTSYDETCVVGGQVLNEEGKPLSSLSLSLKIENDSHVISTTTDKNGYYVFYNVPQNAVISPSLKFNNSSIYPLKGKAFKIYKDELEIDFRVNEFSF